MQSPPPVVEPISRVAAELTGEQVAHDIGERGYCFVAAQAMRQLLRLHASPADIGSFAESWNELPVDPHMADHGRYRRRRYAVLACDERGRVERQAHQPHFQAVDYNRLNGGFERWFEPIEDSIIQNNVFTSAVALCSDIFARLSGGNRRWHIEAHQFRIEALAGGSGLPTPEGMHRDGVDFVLVLLVRRHNIDSGTTLIGDGQAGFSSSFTLTEPFDAALLDDHRVHHGVTPVHALDAAQPAFRDVLVLTFRKPQEVSLPAAAGAWLTPIELGALAAIWGASFMFQRIAAPEFGALPLGELRLVLGGAVLLPFLWRERRAFPLRLWPTLMLIGAINSAVPFTLFAWAAQHAPAGVIAISNSLAVMFTALVAFVFYGERIGGRHALALIAGFAGVVVLASARTAGASIGMAVLAGTAAAFLYGVGVNLVKRKLAHVPPIALAAATLSCAAALLLPFATWTWPQQAISTRSWLAAGALGVVCSGIAYALYYRLIQRIGASRAVTVTYLVPLFAVIWAWLLLGEAPTWRMLIAGVLILGSVALTQASREA